MAYEKPSNRLMLVFAGLLYVVLVLVSGPAIGQKIPGIGIQSPPNGSRVYVTACPPGTSTTPTLNTAFTAFDPYSFEGLRGRYGDCRADGGRFIIDAETIYQRGNIALIEACLCNEFGTFATHDCNTTMTELHDYWATKQSATGNQYLNKYPYAGACADIQSGAPPPTGPSCPNGKPDPGEFCSCQPGEPNCVKCPQDLPPGACDPPTPPPDPIEWLDGKCDPTELAACKTDCNMPPPAPVCPTGTACREEPPTCRPPCDISACIAIARRMDTWTSGSLGAARIKMIDQQLACLLAAEKACAVRP